MRNLAHMPVKGRIAYALLMLKKKFGVTNDGFINIHISRQDIASFAGTTYESAFSAMSELIQEEAIKVEDKNIFIANETKLLGFKDIPTA